jgi:hypothetical protein
VVARSGGGWLTVALIIPLISYSVLATIMIVVLYHRGKSQAHPLEMLPDLGGDNTGAKRRTTVYDRIQPDIALPAKLRVGLGQTLRVGDLEVTPLRVEQTKIRFLNPGGGTDTPRNASLVLHLEMRNISQDVWFKPTDPEFLRAWDPSRGTGMPYTFLEMGNRRVYGGPIRWTADNPPGKRADVYIEGANHNRELGPNESMKTLVCTHPDLRATEHVQTHQGRFLWRVQVRRGLVQVKDREVSATAVIGVEFSKGEIQPSRG